MTKLKIIYWIEKHRTILMIVLSLIMLSFVIMAAFNIDITSFVNNPTIFGVLGTLLGAVIGGMFSLLGSVWINKRQQRALRNLKRKNVIYSPLYDEMVNIHERILIQYPYPEYVEIGEESQTNFSCPRYDAWRRIKLDTRYLEVPDCLKEQLEKLETSIREYLVIRYRADTEVQDILNGVLVENGLPACEIVNVGTVIARYALDGKDADIIRKAMGYKRSNEVDITLKDHLNNRIYDRCNNNEIILETRLRYDSWIKTQEQTIEMLRILIKRVLLQYEG